MISCSKCGAALEDSANFCHACGTAVSAEQNTPAENQASPQTSEQTGVNPPVNDPSPHFNAGQNQYCGYANVSSQNMGYPPPPPYGSSPNPAYPPPYSVPSAKPVDHPTIGEIYSKSFALIGKKPFLLWGLSLLYCLLCVVTVILGVLPILWIPVILVLNVGMVSVFLDAYRGNKIAPEQMFLGFKNFLHFCGGMAWMLLWIFLWGLIPIAGIVFAVIKAYSYRFVPYILLADPQIKPVDALRESMEQTKGYRSRMFGADIIIIACIVVTLLLFYLLGYIPFMGIIFSVIYTLLGILTLIFAPLLFGIIKAAFYDGILQKEAEKAKEDSVSIS